MKIVAKRDRAAQARRFRIKGKNHYKVELRIEGDDGEINNIRSVDYVLHPSFREPVRHSDNKQSNFSTDIWTYGFFPVEAKIIDIDGNETTIAGNVAFD